MQRANLLDAELQRRRQRQRPADSPRQIVRRQVEPDQVEVSQPAATHGVGQQAIDERRAKAGELRGGMFRQGFRIERDARHLPVCCTLGVRQQDVVDLRLDLIPHAADGVEIVAHKHFKRRSRRFRRSVQHHVSFLPKSEIRSSKSETNPNLQIQITETHCPCFHLLISALDLFRISDFYIRIFLTGPAQSDRQTAGRRRGAGGGTRPWRPASGRPVPPCGA